MLSALITWIFSVMPIAIYHMTKIIYKESDFMIADRTVKLRSINRIAMEI